LKGAVLLSMFLPNPEEALANFKAGKYDVLVTDLKMPVISGFELYRKTKAIDDNIIVVFMTAFDFCENEFRKMFSDADVKFFKKPFRISDVAAHVNKLLASRQA
jgi:DNA-binding NtrC family response regulator